MLGPRFIHLREGFLSAKDAIFFIKRKSRNMRSLTLGCRTWTTASFRRRTNTPRDAGRRCNYRASMYCDYKNQVAPKERQSLHEPGQLPTAHTLGWNTHSVAKRTLTATTSPFKTALWICAMLPLAIGFDSNHANTFVSPGRAVVSYHGTQRTQRLEGHTRWSRYTIRPRYQSTAPKPTQHTIEKPITY